ncbi:class I SAM-dependent methyltransferase [Dethiosulfovibrio salsuginis]|uniref:Ubiquinone/menaquinone biosynthesis C-methylase UbiE n=1 Tax=Dethiosulfovibrio salsuginis TaxID=561720 RepID=A0A1X7KQ18_9BACT|nr:class I SAM-dependent methyltransferase [Dethiosulfovibrio salsuginis]SMG43319.1 Ubiquinone/menaquinone biosynthesis C-methylase UbiE [Dethiosulfovibrio salsuginis]
MHRPSEFYSMLAPIYPLLIQQFADDYRLEQGIALDIGTGPGFLGTELAKITDMEIYFVDLSDKALLSARERFERSETDNKAAFVQADVRSLPFEDDFADFIMSRGSIWFWEEPEKGLAEIYRVLKPGGTAIVGGGLGRYIPSSMRQRLVTANRERMKKSGETRPRFEDFSRMIESALLDRAGVNSFRLISEDPEGKSGKWVEIQKKTKNGGGSL